MAIILFWNLLESVGPTNIQGVESFFSFYMFTRDQGKFLVIELPVLHLVRYNDSWRKLFFLVPEPTLQSERRKRQCCQASEDKICPSHRMPYPHQIFGGPCDVANSSSLLEKNWGLVVKLIFFHVPNWAMIKGHWAHKCYHGFCVYSCEFIVFPLGH